MTKTKELKNTHDKKHECPVLLLRFFLFRCFVLLFFLLCYLVSFFLIVFVFWFFYSCCFLFDVCLLDKKSHLKKHNKKDEQPGNENNNTQDIHTKDTQQPKKKIKQKNNRQTKSVFCRIASLGFGCVCRAICLFVRVRFLFSCFI